MTGLLLDTCALIYLSEGAFMQADARRAIQTAAERDGVFVSPVSAWEVALLSAGGRLTRARTPAAVELWHGALMRRRGVHVADFSSAIALDSASLPGFPHRDPADRFLVATARRMSIPLVTRDRKILDHADTGHVRCIPC